MQECLEMIAQEVFEGDMARASVLFGRQPLLLSYSDRIGPLVRLMTDELKATVPQVSFVVVVVDLVFIDSFCSRCCC